ncbi:ionotropic receptor 75a isoform X2 [Drosophila mojavensis]|uniref:ionotropic receptor 75a isoform X2 n=1 Tax=Drosophila mojavensis TaxID=7230 RepID=UPI001CD1871C|nr:ionotropic receptor 75a isoform X2 [Drosophila mojavensis]
MHSSATRVVLTLVSIFSVTIFAMEGSVILDYNTRLVRTKQCIIFACSEHDMYFNVLALMAANQFVQPVHMNSSYDLVSILTRENYARTSVIVDTTCEGAPKLLKEASANRYFNKTYQWLLWGVEANITDLLPIDLDYVGPNAQLTYVNKTSDAYFLWDVHSKGRQLKSPLELRLIAKLSTELQKLVIINEIFDLQSIKYRSQFNGLTLRGASVIDQEDILTNQQIEAILSRPTKDAGVAAFIKYHYELLSMLRDLFNFTVNFRNSRGWAGRLGNTTFRLGLLGIIKRNEADIAASGAFNRINRFAEFDTIHQSWKFETAFLFRFTPDLDTRGKSGNFLAPFSRQVWLFTVATLIGINSIWLLLDYLSKRWHSQAMQCIEERIFNIRNSRNLSSHPAITNSHSKWTERILLTFGAVCQQGMEPIPRDIPSRSIVLTVFLFSVVMYNYYTSSVVGGLLSSSDLGPATVDEITNSPLKVSFEDIGYYKVLFKESSNPIVTRLISKKLSASRGPNEMGVYGQIEDAIPYLKRGGFAFHCEVVDAYPIIAELFDANEICDLREVSGLMEVEIMNWIVHKNSQYTELFRTAMCKAREVGLVERLLRQRQMKKPECQSLYTVYPVTITGVSSAFLTLLSGVLIALFALCLEIASVKWQIRRWNRFFRHTRVHKEIAIQDQA